jgi:uncharacterized protein with PIN domain
MIVDTSAVLAIVFKEPGHEELIQMSDSVVAVTPARLNFGDCLSYATAKLAGQPLLYVGNDFSKTDIEKA